jgi:hypothetical protein
MKNDGYVLLPRAIIDDAYFAQKFTKAQALIDLYFLAAHTDRTFYIRGNKVELKRGQLAMAERNLAERWRWSKNTVHAFINSLAESGKIGLQKSRVINVISLNYYGMSDPQSDPQNDPPIIKGKLKDNFFLEKKKRKDEKTRNKPTKTDADQVLKNLVG